LKGSVTFGTLTTLGFTLPRGAVVFGSGLAIVPFLHGGVVDEHHWLTDRQFSMLSRRHDYARPVVITVAFIGYLVAGRWEPASPLGVFCLLLFVIIPPFYRRFADNVSIKAFVDASHAQLARSRRGLRARPPGHRRRRHGVFLVATLRFSTGQEGTGAPRHRRRGIMHRSQDLMEEAMRWVTRRHIR